MLVEAVEGLVESMRELVLVSRPSRENARECKSACTMYSRGVGVSLEL